MKIPNDIRIFGDVNFRGKCHKEDYVLSSFINYVRNNHPKYAKVCFHVKNESKRTPMQAKADKAKGMTKGVSDVIIIGHPTFCPEIKRQDHTQSTISDEQIEFLRQAKENGAFPCILLGYDACIEAFNFWLSLQP